MTRTTSARLAGFMFLFYIATAFPSLLLYGQAAAGNGTAARLASIAQHGVRMRVSTVLSLVTIFDAMVLAVALYALTRDYDRDLAVLALSCRVGEGVMNAVATIAMIALLSVAEGSRGVATDALGSLLLKAQDWTMLVSATIFAVGSTLFAYLFLRARSIPVWLARLGLLGSILVVIGLPAQIAGLIKAPLTSLMWIPVGAFEVIAGVWLLTKGVASQRSA
jgi:hypothetical protein